MLYRGIEWSFAKIFSLNKYYFSRRFDSRPRVIVKNWKRGIKLAQDLKAQLTENLAGNKRNEAREYLQWNSSGQIWLEKNKQPNNQIKKEIKLYL